MHASNAADNWLVESQCQHYLPGLRNHDPIESRQTGRIRRSDGTGVRGPAADGPNRALNHCVRSQGYPGSLLHWPGTSGRGVDFPKLILIVEDYPHGKASAPAMVAWGDR